MLRRLVPLIALVTTPVLAQPPVPDRAGWIADFETAKAAITRSSPNLEWQAMRGLDLAAIEARARARLDAASTPDEARDALRRFVRPFADGHMEFRPAVPLDHRPASAAANERPDCAALGIEDRPDDGAIATRLPGYRTLAPGHAAVPAGIANIAGRHVGVLRIAMFSPALAHCRAVLASIPLPPRCNARCREQLSTRIDNAFLDEIAERLRDLLAAGAEVLLVDLADNGGGNDTAIAVARMLGGKDVPTPPLWLARTPATARDLADELADLDRATPTRADRASMTDYRPRLTAAIGQAQKPCDLSALWRGGAVACTNLVRRGYAGGLSALDLPTEQRDRPWAPLVSATAAYSFPARRWPGPVLLLVDGNSASATELLAAMLQDARRATVVGAPTFGAGCGFTRPPEPVPLPHLGLVLGIPDCARLRPDKTNEIDGIVPDILVPFREFDTPAQRVRRLLSVLPTVLAGAKRTRG